ncbi:DUF1007 family protein [Marinivivus vitaminiproducens]|uniref:DUF1007 family protein n=1 Tax=Marinivivus vitaminiproducens TaxID=3035935 RepID=UPI00279C1C02|nr:DUF1007 family protein [Geminicoccaceae bacterium SCSIO 64248]
MRALRGLVRHVATIGCVLALAGGLAFPRPATAHPHVWIDTRLDFLFDRNRLTGLNVSWTFDELFSDYVLNDVGYDGGGELSDAQVETIRKNAFFELRQYNFYTDIRIDGGKLALPPERVRDFDVALDGHQVIYRFRVDLPEPVDTRSHHVTVSPYDPEFYVEMALAPDEPVRIEGGAACRPTVGENRAEPIYFGMVYPIVVSLSCAGS